MIQSKEKAKQNNGTSLAYLGDAVFEVLVRGALIECGITDTGRFNALALSFVTAKAQSDAYLRIEPLLYEDELEIARRGKNAHLTHHPKNQSLSDYRRATGFEALFGYLHLCGQTERARELFAKAFAEQIDGIKNGSV